MIRIALSIQGIVQGVGFRPFVHAAAVHRGLSGWVQNGTDGVRIEVQGPAEAVREFVGALRSSAPPAARIDRFATAELLPVPEIGFVIVESQKNEIVRATLPPDLATCAECIAEVTSLSERRHRYPFTNCTRCGPRFTIIERLPYDRPNTTMARFELCAACRREYEAPADRRFHAQPIACATCGPKLRLVDADGTAIAAGDEALEQSASALLQGDILALKGLGGFQLLVDATNMEVVARLRARKRRDDKPFAVMFPSLKHVHDACALNSEEEALLCSPEAPIVLLRRKAAPGCIADNVAPANPRLGVMLPYTPLHLLLLGLTNRPLVCTSGNLSDEPMCIEEDEARVRLAGIADLYLVHDRPIVRPMDDSVARLGPTGLQLLRRARGYTPLPHAFPDGPCILALGGQLKSTVTLCKGDQAVVSQHIGDLFTLEATLLLDRMVTDLLAFFEAKPEVIVCDLHPDYASTRLAERLASAWQVPLDRVQHHHAHVAACMAEHQLEGPVLGLAWDGAGLGPDGTLWGGEALVVDGPTFRRIAHLRPFPLPGGERAIREPRRAALGLLFDAFGSKACELLPGMFSDAEIPVLRSMLERRLQSPQTTSIGRLFDAVAAIAGIRSTAGFEGQAAMALEFAAYGVDDRTAYPLPLSGGVPAIADWQPLVTSVLRDRDHGLAASVIAARFHNALVDLAETLAIRAGVARVVLSGGCFQNLRLTQAIHERLVARGFQVYVPERFPANDGSLSLGQAYVVALRRKADPCASASPVK